ncbi:ORF6C domain-containing protein [Cetobacterium sp. 8H]|uniref:ORF6C domain-containing protein n=2 Tax=unclassified Cetobacterium TaxID=2630983 RepID=UPI00163B9DC3|nr:ORF6C domain-containing protein [Cetobacterium sp. 8H]MBC2849847.1 ORF6C domain-containing protein [Cetobacterium sp. 8H]MBC2849864.1 ORF6C domain-containing protein [Cetobacterium sp. 8H]
MESITKKEIKYITSLELLEEINFFRKQEGNRTKLKHYDLLKIIRDEFEEEIGAGKISESSYKNSQNKEYPMFELIISQAKQILVRESKFVRKSIIKKLDEIENRSLEIQNENKNVIKATRNFLMVVTNQENRLRELEQKIETITSFITPEDRFNLKKAIDFKVYERANYQNMNDDRSLLYRNLYKDLKNKFRITKMEDIKKSDLSDILDFICNWREDKNLKRR